MEKVTLNWQSDMAFDAIINDQVIHLDAPQDGSTPTGVRPKPLLLVALAGCTGMDIASLSKKMRLTISSLKIDALAEKNDTMPIVYLNFTLNYYFEAPHDHSERIIKMVTNSQEKYCGVRDMLLKVGPIKYNIYLNSALILSK